VAEPGRSPMIGRVIVRPEMPPEYEQQVRFHVKSELRRRMRGVRGAMQAEARAERSRAVVARLRDEACFAQARTVAAFVAIRGEVDLAPLLTLARDAGKTVLLPRVDDAEDVLALHVHAPDAPLEASRFGVPEPRPDAPIVAPHAVDLILVPGLVFDERGHRLGYGAGYYDRLLPKLTRAVSIGVAFDFQLVPELPDTPGDVPLSRIVTDARIHVPQARA
jgi:5-formyltetrahydrofolate cyclo-ligase